MPCRQGLLRHAIPADTTGITMSIKNMDRNSSSPFTIIIKYLNALKKELQKYPSFCFVTKHLKMNKCRFV